MTTTEWQAQLSLRFAARSQRTVLVERSHSGPLVVQKALYPEGERICHAVIVHPPGGIAGGDQLRLHSRLESNAHVLLTTPGASKWYKANGRSATQHVQLDLAEDAILEWLPQETILFDAAQVRTQMCVNLAAGAKFAGWEILCLGRRAAGEKFITGSLRQRIQIWRDEELLWNEVANFSAGSRPLLSPVGMHGRSISAVFSVAAGPIPMSVLEACRALTPIRKGSEENAMSYGVTALPEIFAARFLGDSAEQAREYFEQLWRVLRPWYANTDMQRPRIWST